MSGIACRNFLKDPTSTVFVDWQGRRTVVGINPEISLKSLIESVNLVCQDLLSVQSEDKIEQLKRKKKAFEYSNRVIELYEKSEESKGFLEKAIYRIIRFFTDREFYTVLERCKKHLDDSRSFEELGRAFPLGYVYAKSILVDKKLLYQIPREVFLQVISKAIKIETEIKHLEKKISSLERWLGLRGKDSTCQKGVVEKKSRCMRKDLTRKKVVVKEESNGKTIEFLKSGNLTVNVTWSGDRIVSNGQRKMALKALVKSVNQIYRELIFNYILEDEEVNWKEAPDHEEVFNHFNQVIELYEKSRGFLERVFYCIVRIFVDKELYANLRQCRKNLEAIRTIRYMDDELERYMKDEDNEIPFKANKILHFDGVTYLRYPKEFSALMFSSEEGELGYLKGRLKKLECREAARTAHELRTRDW